jgi:hypothetical protein
MLRSKTVSPRIRNGSVAAIVVLEGLASHSQMDALVRKAKQHGVPTAYARRGGFAAISSALVQVEEQLRRKAA